MVSGVCACEGGRGGKSWEGEPHSTYVLLVRFPRGPFPISSSRAGGEDVSSPPPPTIATCLRTEEYSAVSVFLLLGGLLDRSPSVPLSRGRRKKKGAKPPRAQPTRDLTHTRPSLSGQKADRPTPAQLRIPPATIGRRSTPQPCNNRTAYST